jgi:uncharacterized membrane protein YkoI
MKPIILALVLIPLINVPVVYHAEAENLPQEVLLKPVDNIWREDEVINFITAEAKKNGVSVDLAVKIVKCEAPWKIDKDGRYYDMTDAQSNIRYNAGQISRHPNWGNVGERENSFGIWQWHLPDNNITKDEANDVEISTERAMKELKAGKQSMWTCSK